VAALQTITVPGSAARPVTIPAEGASTSNIAVQSNSACPAMAPLHTNCAQYTLIEPASNPRVGVFSAGKISYAAPASGNVPYSIRANAFTPLSGGISDCSPSSKLATLDSMGNPLKVTPGATAAAAEIDFAGCS
jgi:hypothetical protein